MVHDRVLSLVQRFFILMLAVLRLNRDNYVDLVKPIRPAKGCTMTTAQRLSRHAELGGYDGLRARSIPLHEYGNETTGTQRQVVCSCGWRSKVWSRDNEQPIDDQWLAHVASIIPHKVVLNHSAVEDDCGSRCNYQIFKELGGEWQQCNREDPSDHAAFVAAGLIDWTTRKSGEYLLESLDIADAA